MPDISANLGLNLPKGTDFFDYDVHLRQNFQKIDDQLKSDIVETYTSSAGQTVVNMVHPYTLGTGALSVRVDGVPQFVGSGYTETSTTSITFTEGLVDGQNIEIVIQGLAPASDARFNEIDSQLADKAPQSDVDNLSSLTPKSKSAMLVTASGTGVFNGDITTTSGVHGAQINTPNLSKITFLQSNIHADGYGMLLNTNSDGGENLLIALNNIYSSTADAIELNNPSTNPFKNVRVIGNKLTADVNGTSINAGFSLGIAKTRNVSAIGNISNLSRAEGLHIEDDQENVVVIGNIFDQCKTDGARILNNFGNSKPVIVIGNHFVKANLDKTNNGIWRVYGGNGAVDCDLSHNRVRGFDVGLWMDGRWFANLEGCIVEDCNIGIKTGDSTILRGSVFLNNTPTLVQGGSGAIIDKVVSKTQPTTIMQYTGTAGQEGATLKGFSAKTSYTSTAGVANTIDMFPLPSLMTGKIKITKRGADKIYCIADVSWDGTTLTVTNLMKKNAGVIGGTFTLVNNNGKLAITVSNIANVQTFDLYYDFDGVYYQE